MATANVMSFRPIGGPQLGITSMLKLKTGFEIPQLGFGTYRMGANQAQDAVSYAMECGYRHVDCAKAYGNQKEVGAALQQALRTRRVRRDGLFVTSKLWPTDQHPDVVEATCRETLAELKLDYLDLYLIHWPVCWKHSAAFNTDADKYPKLPDGQPARETAVTLADTWRAMNGLVAKGLVRSIGLSNCNAEQVQSLTTLSEAEGLSAPVVNQIECHLGLPNTDLSLLHASLHMVTEAYCPLGMPTRFTPPDFEPLVNDDTLRRLSDHTGFSVPRLLLNNHLDTNNVVIVKSTNKEHIRSNAKAARFAHHDHVRVVFDGYSTQVRSFRVMNPVGYLEAGKPFFHRLNEKDGSDVVIH